MNVAVLHNEDGLLRHGTLLNHHAAEEIHWHEAILGKILCERSAQLLIPASIFAPVEHAWSEDGQSLEAQRL